MRMFSIVSLVIIPGCSSSEDAAVRSNGESAATSEASNATASDQIADLRTARPLAPLSGAIVGKRPTLRWALPGHQRETIVDLCRDRGCTSRIGSFDVHGDRVRIERDLPAGAVYWRLHASHGHGSAAVSPTWEIFVVRGAPCAASSAGALDVNGDGHADVAVASAIPGSAFLFLGGDTGIQPTPISLQANASAVGRAGDVDGDGYGELLVGSGSELLVFPGGPSGTAVTPAHTLPWPGAAFAAIGDFDGDGYGDVIVADPANARALLYFGSRAGLAVSPGVVLRAPQRGIGFAASVAAAGDIDGDGRGDVVVGAPDAAGGAGRAYVYRAGCSGATPYAVLAPPDDTASGGFGSSVAGAGDVDGDGQADIAVGALRGNRVYVFRNQRRTFRSPIVIAPSVGRFAGGGVAGVGDANEDGFCDIGIAAAVGTADAGDVGLIEIYEGSAAGTLARSAVNLTDESAGGRFGTTFASPGDIDGDGLPDLVVGAPISPTTIGGSRPGPGRVYRFASPANFQITQSLAGEDFVVRQFGVSVD